MLTNVELLNLVTCSHGADQRSRGEEVEKTLTKCHNKIAAYRRNWTTTPKCEGLRQRGTLTVLNHQEKSLIHYV